MSKEKEKILVSEFVKKYKELTNEDLKERYVKSHITSTYAPFLLKVNLLTLMNEKSVADDKVKYIDLNTSKLNFIMAILSLYTDITPDKKTDDDGNITVLSADAYDSLKSTGLLEKILTCIGKDLEELLAVQNDVIETWYNKNKSTDAYVTDLAEKLTTRFAIIAGDGLEKLADALDDEVKVKRLTTILDKVFKKK